MASLRRLAPPPQGRGLVDGRAVAVVQHEAHAVLRILFALFRPFEPLGIPLRVILPHFCIPPPLKSCSFVHWHARAFVIRPAKAVLRVDVPLLSGPT